MKVSTCERLINYASGVFLSSGSYLPAGYSFPSYGGKMGGGDEGEKPSRSSPTVKPPGEAKALDLLQQHASQYKSKSPSIQDNKSLHDRDRERDREREREGDRPRSSPSQRILPSHHHLGYPLLSGQYDLSYASGETRTPPRSRREEELGCVSLDFPASTVAMTSRFCPVGAF